MKALILIIVSILSISCNPEPAMPEFITNDPKKIDQLSDQALQEAQQMLDSLEKTPILDTNL